MTCGRELKQSASALQEALASAGRLSALLLLGEGPIARKRDRAREASQRIEQAFGLQELLARCFQVRPRPVVWPESLRPDRAGLLARRPGAHTDSATEVELQRAQALLAQVLLQAAARCAEALRTARSTELLEPMVAPLEAIGRTLPAAPADMPAEQGATPLRPQPARAATPGSPEQALRGPLCVGLDPIYAPTFSLLDPQARKAMDSHRGPHFWNLSLREVMAGELCALSLVEAEGLPLAFHRDFSKQAWDELRHARLFLDLGLELLPDFLATAPADHPLRQGAERYLATGAGLPVPIERSLYEAIWNCTLAERLVLLHLDTEAPGVAGFRRELRSAFCRERPALAERLEIATHDEAAHARLGKQWLSHLIPNAEARRAHVEDTLLLRGVLLLAGMSHYHRQPLEALIAEQAGAAA